MNVRHDMLRGRRCRGLELDDEGNARHLSCFVCGTTALPAQCCALFAHVLRDFSVTLQYSGVLYVDCKGLTWFGS